jgi:hypothetical protein
VPPHTGDNENHVRPLQAIGNALSVFRRGTEADFCFCTSAPAGLAQLNQGLRAASFERPRIGIGHDKFNAVNSLTNHVLNGLPARAANANDLDDEVVIADELLFGRLSLER